MTTQPPPEPNGLQIQEFQTEDGFDVKAYSIELPLKKTNAFADGSARSQQITPDEEKVYFTVGGEFLSIDYDPETWARTPEMNTRVRTSCRVVARNVAGIQWTVQPIKNEMLLSPEELEVVQRQTERLLAIFNNPNPEIPLSETLYRCWYDRKATGKGHLEITRTAGNLIDGVYHLQSKYVYPLKNGGWAQQKGQDKRYFKKFGDLRVINATTGEVHDASKGALSIEERATEVITFIEYSSDLEVIGAPPHASASTAISGNWYAAQRNRNTQVTDATPRAIITVQGGALSEKSEESIHRFLNASARNEDDMRSNRIMVLTVQKTTPTSSVTPSIDVKPLTIASSEDATFLKYRSANDDEVREAYGMAALYYGSTEGTNRASAGVARHITIEQVFKPETEELAYALNHSLVKNILSGYGYAEKDILVQFAFIRPPAADEVEQSQVISRYIQGGGLSPNDIRRYLIKQGFDLEPWEGAWAELPLFVTLAVLKVTDDPDAMGIPLDAEATPEDGEEPVDESAKSSVIAMRKAVMMSVQRNLRRFGKNSGS